VTLKVLFLLTTVPLGVWTLMVDVTALFGRVALMVVDDTTANVAETTPNCTAVAPVNPVPLMVSGVPTGPIAGVKPEMVGEAAAADVADPTSEPPASATTAHAAVSHRR
jgi:hypothetical protein